MKDALTTLGPPGSGMSRAALLMAKKTRTKFGDNGSPLAQRNAATLEYDPNTKWNVRTAEGESSVAHGSYIYATMMDGITRVGSIKEGEKNAHAALTGQAEYLLYAGQVEANNGNIEKYSNQSGTYLPTGALSYQAGFSRAAGFVDMAQSTISQNDAAKNAAMAAATQAIETRLRRNSI